MLLNEAVQKARKDLGLSQKRLSELAGIQRRQLATLESGGNVTLATVRKVIAHLPNLEGFTLDGVPATVKREASREERAKVVASAMQILQTALHSLVDAVAEGRPLVEAEQGFKEVNEMLRKELGRSPEEDARRRQQHMEQVVAAGPMTAEGLAALAKSGLMQLEELKQRVPRVEEGEFGEDEPLTEDVEDDSLEE